MQRDSSGGPVFRTPRLPVQEVRVRFLVRELRSYLSHDAVKKKKNAKNYTEDLEHLNMLSCEGYKVNM